MAPGREDNVKARLVVVSSPDAPELSVLKSLPPEVKVMGIGRSLSDIPGVPAQVQASPVLTAQVPEHCMARRPS
jgi:hypothetical protein